MTDGLFCGIFIRESNGFHLFHPPLLRGAVVLFLSYCPTFRGIAMTEEVIKSVEAIVATGKEAIVKKEHGKWVVIENGRRLIYREQQK